MEDVYQIITLALLQILKKQAERQLGETCTQQKGLRDGRGSNMHTDSDIDSNAASENVYILSGNTQYRYKRTYVCTEKVQQRDRDKTAKGRASKKRSDQGYQNENIYDQ